MTNPPQSSLEPLDKATLLDLLDPGEASQMDWAAGAVHPDPQIRLSVVALAAEDGSAEAVDLLNWALQDECDEVSVRAIEAWAELAHAEVSPLLVDLASTEWSTNGGDARASAARRAVERFRKPQVDQEAAPDGDPAPDGDRAGLRLREEAETADMRPVEIPGEAGELYVDARPVSWEQVARFIKEVGVTGRSWRPVGSPPADYTGALRLARVRIADGRGHEPATVLNWYDACAYAAWRGCRLPRVHELSATESTQGVGGWDSVSAELTATRRLDHGSLVPFAGIDAYRDTADEWTLEGALFQPGVDVNRLGGRHVLRIGGGVGFRCVHSDVLTL